MKCPFCDNQDTKVIDSRPTEDGYEIRRRRECENCHRRFTTYEKMEEPVVMIIKRDGRREPFDRAKLKSGIVKACEKRPVSMDTIDGIVEQIERGLNNLMEKEVKSEFLGELVMEELKKIDQVAYIRFASVYLRFNDAETFAREVAKLQDQKGGSAEGVYQVAIDGPGGAGKSTIAKLVASKLGIDYIDTGAMYRCVALKAVSFGVPDTDHEALREMLDSTSIDFDGEKVILDGVDVSKSIRTQAVSDAASRYAGIPEVRHRLVDLQRAIGIRKSVVMDGRDIGTNVFKGAKYKFFLTASPEERAERRYKELVEKGEDVDRDEILKEIKERDYRDTHRDLDPLRCADDAIKVDTTKMSIDEVVDALMNRIKE